MKKKENKKTKIKYTWKFWCLVISEITLIVIFILLFGLSIKALVQDIQINTYKYKAEGTVTVAEFYGKTWVSNGSDSGSSSNMIATERYYGDRYLVLFNKDIDKAELIQKEDVFIDNVILMIFIVIVVLIFLLRKKIYLWLTKLEKKMNSFIIYQ